MKDVPDSLPNITQVAARVGVREKVIQRATSTGELRSLKIGKAVRYRWSDVDVWLDTLASKDPATIPVGRSGSKRIPEGSAGTAEPVVALVKGPQGRNRARLRADGHL